LVAYQLLMEEPSPRTSRLALAAAVAAAVLIGGAGFLLGRGTAPPRTQIVEAPQPAPESESWLSGVLGRAGLIALASSAADAAASGRPPDPAVVQAEGRRFELRLPFGCAGEAAEDSDESMRWQYDADSETLRIVVAPEEWSADYWWPDVEEPGVDAVEGFWLERPWTASETCPQRADELASGRAATPKADADAAEEEGAGERTLALGQIFYTEGPRRGRRQGDPYQAVVRVSRDALDSSQGFRLKLTGRLARNLREAPVWCRQVGSARSRPVCLVSVIVDEIAIENPSTGEIIAQWTFTGRGARQPRSLPPPAANGDT
jgi:hypothetical protein